MKMKNKFFIIKKIFIAIGVAALIFTVFGCAQKIIKKIEVDKAFEKEKFVETTEAIDIFDFDNNYGKKKIAVAYFSATGNTKKVAEKVAELFECDTIEIEPEIPYTETDLTSYDPSTRPMRENEYDPFYPPEFAEGENIPEGTILELPKIKKINLDRYDTIFLGFPIWFSDAPKVIYTFISTVNLKNKTILPFCTSGSDDISPADQNLANFASEDTAFMTGARFTVDSTIDEIKAWAREVGVDLPK